MRESAFQTQLKKKLRTMFPGCMILKNDPTHLQGVPDLTILHRDRWAVLEVKASEDAPHQPNQDHYIAQMAGMSFAAFVWPANEAEVLNELQLAFRSPRRNTRVSKS